MGLSEARDVFNSVKQDKISGSIACGVAIISLIIAAFFRLEIAVFLLKTHFLLIFVLQPCSSPHSIV